MHKEHFIACITILNTRCVELSVEHSFNILTGSNHPDEWFLKRLLLLITQIQLENAVTGFTASTSQTKSI
jgi:hypothetical protein